MVVRGPIKVGKLTPSISAAAGGIDSAFNGLCTALRNEGVALQIFAREESDNKLAVADRYQNKAALLPVRGPLSFSYLPQLVSRLEAAQLDVLHLHGLWMYPSVAANTWRRKTGMPTLVSPHGMLDPWALRNAGWKKRLAGWLYENNNLRGAACIHALCESEYESIRRYGLHNPVAVVPNGTDLPDTAGSTRPSWAKQLPANSRVLIFLGRYHPKKGLADLLRGWAFLQESNLQSAEPWRLVLAGWDQQGHRNYLAELAAELKIAPTVHFLGPQFGQDKADTLAYADALVLPSLSEGLPMAVLEAWSYGLPVLMTEKCNLPEGFTARAAFPIQPDPQSISDSLRRLSSLSDAERRAMGERGRELVKRRFAWPGVAAEMRGVYEWLSGRGPRPDSIRTE